MALSKSFPGVYLHTLPQLGPLYEPHILAEHAQKPEVQDAWESLSPEQKQRYYGNPSDIGVDELGTSYGGIFRLRQRGVEPFDKSKSKGHYQSQKIFGETVEGAFETSAGQRVDKIVESSKNLDDYHLGSLERTPLGMGSVTTSLPFKHGNTTSFSSNMDAQFAPYEVNYESSQRYTERQIQIFENELEQKQKNKASAKEIAETKNKIDQAKFSLKKLRFAREYYESVQDLSYEELPTSSNLEAVLKLEKQYKDKQRKILKGQADGSMKPEDALREQYTLHKMKEALDERKAKMMFAATQEANYEQKMLDIEGLPNLKLGKTAGYNWHDHFVAMRSEQMFGSTPPHEFGHDMGRRGEYVFNLSQRQDELKLRDISNASAISQIDTILKLLPHVKPINVQGHWMLPTKGDEDLTDLQKKMKEIMGDKYIPSHPLRGNQTDRMPMERPLYADLFSPFSIQHGSLYKMTGQGDASTPMGSAYLQTSDQLDVQRQIDFLRRQQDMFYIPRISPGSGMGEFFKDPKQLEYNIDRDWETSN